MRRLFTEHPNSVGENYFQHLVMAFQFSGKMFATAIACLLHGVFPFLFVNTGSKFIAHLNESMIVNRKRKKTAGMSGPDCEGPML